MQTLPSIEVLAQLFACEPRIKAEHHDHGVLNYEVEFETEDERVNLDVLPVAEEIYISIFTKKPPRFIRLGLEDVSRVQIVNDDGYVEADKAVEIHFHNTQVQTLTLRLRPVFTLFWGNQHHTPDRYPPWERN